MPISVKRAEARCRYYTRDEARRLGWDVRHPSEGGRFLEEQELIDYFPALRTALGADRPDFGAIGVDGNLRAVIECKNDYRQLETAIDEAKGYASAINGANRFDVRLAIGIAGTPDTFVQTRGHFLNRNNKWVALKSHEYPLTQLPTPIELDIAIRNNDGTTDVQLPDEAEFFDAAINISNILRYAKIPDADRPKVIGAIVLALYRSDFSYDPEVVLEQINANVSAAISSNDFKDVEADRRAFLAKTLTLSAEFHTLRSSVKEIVFQLERLNVRSIMRSEADFLGKFYETFLRYGCNTSNMGIVFTPRHITRYCADLLDVKVGMKVYDAAAGTGGFLVAAYDRMMKEATTPAAKKIVKSSLYGCETNPTVWALNILNMFFRGDGKSKIVYNSCFEQDYENIFQRALLNPPYSQEGEHETNFIDHALKSLVPGGEVAVVVKSAIVVDRKLRAWRKALVENNHVLAVISLPTDLFYPTAVPTVILVVRAGTPDVHRGTFLAQIRNDGYTISKKRRVPIDGEQLTTVGRLYRDFLRDGVITTIPNLAMVVERSKIENGEEICAEQWLPSPAFGFAEHEQNRLEIVRQMSMAVANYPSVADELIENYEEELGLGTVRDRPKERTVLSDWFVVESGKSSGAEGYPGGSVPYVSSADQFNSIIDFLQPPDDEIYDTPVVSITGFGQAYLQPWRFVARGNGGSAVRVLRPRYALSLAELTWFVGQVNSQKWRFHYGRMAGVKRLEQLEVDPPPIGLPVFAGLIPQLQSLRKGISHFFTGQKDAKESFQTLQRAWKVGRERSSSAIRMAEHPAYRQIVNMGETALPFIIEELKKKPDHWFIALHEITKANPVPAQSRGDIRKMSSAWIEWAKTQGIK